MRLTAEEYIFDFPDALSLVKFDGESHGMTHCMKAVDVVAEFENVRLYIEVKSYEANSKWLKKGVGTSNDRELMDSLTYKYRDSYLYHLCKHQKKDKKSIFVFLTDWTNTPIINGLTNRLQERFPRYGTNPEWKGIWKETFIDAVTVVNPSIWSNNILLSRFGSIIPIP